MIPHLIHQTWKSTTVPQSLQNYCKSWTQLNPECEYRLYDDTACLAYVRDKFPQYLDVYTSFPIAVQRADFFRYLIVYDLGGLYVDIDMECLRPMMRFFQSSAILFSVEARVSSQRQRELGYRHPYQIANCIFASEPRHPFLFELIERIVECEITHPSRSANDVMGRTGPHFLSRFFYDWDGTGVRVLKQIYWMPPLSYPEFFPLNLNMFARHHFFGSWKRNSRDPSLKRRWIERDLLPNPFPSNSVYQF